MDRNFPHLPGSSSWPGSGRNIYEQIEGSFDPEVWDEGATLILCSVPWGIYEAGVCDDVPGFDSAADRDAWFSQWLSATHTETHTLDTAVRYQLSRSVELPFTFDSLARYNYLIVDYPAPPVPEAASPTKRWYYHIVDYTYEAPSCTSLLLQPDWWTQCACEMTYNHMMLERGHAPLTMVTADEYLSSPLDHTHWLMGDDPSFGTLSKIAASNDRVFNNGNQWIVLCFAGISLDRITTKYQPPITGTGDLADGGPGDYELAVSAPDFSSLMVWLEENNPKYFFYIDAIYMCDESLLAFTKTFQLGGITVKAGISGTTIKTTLQINKEAFGYSSKAAGFAKLYTYPYAVIEIADHTGSVIQIRVEDLASSTIEANTVFNSAYPWLNLNTHVPGIGGSTKTLSFKTINRESFTGGGRWWDTLFSWGVPCFKISVSNEIRNEVQSYWDRVQAKNNADTTLANANASADTAYNNAVTNATTALNNANASADTAYSNSTASNATANTNAKASNTTALNNNTRTNDTVKANQQLSNAFNTAIQAVDHEWLVKFTADGNSVTTAVTEADITLNRFISDLTNQEIAMTSALNQISSGVSAAAQSIAGYATGDMGPGQAIGNILGAGISNFFASTASDIVISKNESLVSAATATTRTKLRNQLSQTAYNQGYADVVSNAHVTRSNNLADGTTDNSVATSKANAAADYSTGNANADRTKATADANATRSRDTSKANALRSYNSTVDTAAASRTTAKANAQRTYNNSIEAITNGVNTANLQTSVTMGSPADGETFNTRPMFLSVHVLTQNQGAIDRAAAMFARYGYTLDADWEFKSFNLCKHFTYWKVSSLWATAPYLLPEKGQDAVRRMLYDGVTAWKNPEEIGTVSIYEN